MFRRFMIVCWVVFSLGAVVGLVGWAGYEYSERQPAILVAQAQEEVDAGRLPPHGTVATVLPGNEGGEVFRIESTPDSIRIRDMSDPFGVAGILGAYIAVPLLIWNLICHLCHWIWMGRKVE